MEFVLIAIVLAAVFASIAYPILNPPRIEKKQAAALDELIAQRDSVYQAIRDLDFDYQLGKLSADDHRALRERYVAHAATTLQQIDAVAAEPPEARQSSLLCGNCGTPHELEDEFCRRCGNKLS